MLLRVDKRFVFILILCLLGSALIANGPSLVENKGQWHPNVRFKAELDGAHAYIDRDGLSFLLHESDFFDKRYRHYHGEPMEGEAKQHAIKFRFEGMDFGAAQEKSGKKDGPQHFFLGNDPMKWARDVYGYESVVYKDLKPGIDARFDLRKGVLKYAFTLAPGVDPAEVSLRIEGADRTSLEAGELVVHTSVGSFRELAPFAYQIHEDGQPKRVTCHYHLRKDRLSYRFPDGYREDLPLIIDPELAFSSYIGSTSSSFGFTASYDNEGNLYAGAIVFGDLYPTTPGAVQTTYAGGSVDCGITKFSGDGSQLLYSTLLGGAGNEAPHSIVVSDAGEAYILGTTGSSAFPTTPGVVQDFFNGGTTVFTSIGFTYTSGSDLFVSKLSPNGDELLASTYLGGFGNDGVSSNTALDYNYGDSFRGEIVLDAEGNAYIASQTRSNNFPIVGGYASEYPGQLTGVLVKLNPSLSQIIWSTYTGGNEVENAVGLQLAVDGSVYFSGTTSSTNLGNGDSYQGNNAGDADAYVGHVSADGSTLLHYTYLGTNDFDLGYFVQLDTEGNVYVIGQSEGSYPVSGDVYSNPNSGQWIQKLSPDLSEGLWSTVLGTGQGGVDISPSAFLVSDCGQIYVAGWGGEVNPIGGSTTGLPVTPDAFQTTTNGSDFYLMVLAPEAESLVYATFIGGNMSNEHVDGGTSRFDKDGTVYHAVCAGCGGNSDFPTQPGVWSQSNNSNNCNMAVFKFILSNVSAIASIEEEDAICPGTVINFINGSSLADSYLWDFGDGTQSSDFQPSHTYESPGTYVVSLYAESTDECIGPDSTSIVIEVESGPELIVDIPEVVCPGEPAELEASGGESYFWSPSEGLSANNIPNPIFQSDLGMSYTLLASTNCGTQSATIDIEVDGSDIGISNDVSICLGMSVQIEVDFEGEVEWSPAEGLSSTTTPSTTASPQETTEYTATFVTDNGCELSRSMTVVLLDPPPVLEGDTVAVSCNGQPAQLNVSGAQNYVWSPSTALSSTTGPNTQSLPESSITYTVVGSNACGSDSMQVLVLVNFLNITLEVDSLVCPSQPFEVSAQGGELYQWIPSERYQDATAQTTFARFDMPGYVEVQGMDADGCSSSAQAWVSFLPSPFLFAGRDRIIRFGDDVQIESNSDYPITWEYSPYLSCLNCDEPIASPLETTTFYASVVDENGCEKHDSLQVFVEGNLYVPNAFSPNGDGLNDIFRAEGIDVDEFRMEIYNRWGQLVFSSSHIDEAWDGSHQGSEYFCPAGLYPYRIVARVLNGQRVELSGHVTLIR